MQLSYDKPLGSFITQDDETFLLMLNGLQGACLNIYAQNSQVKKMNDKKSVQNSQVKKMNDKKSLQNSQVKKMNDKKSLQNSQVKKMNDKKSTEQSGEQVTWT